MVVAVPPPTSSTEMAPAVGSMVGGEQAADAAKPLAYSLADAEGPSPAAATVPHPAAAPAAATGLPPTATMVPPPAAVGLLPSSTAAPDAQTAFLDKITRRTSSLLPGPSVSRHRGMSVPPRVCAHRSHRLVGVEAEVIPADLGGRPRKKAMRSLNIIDEHGSLTQQAQDEYFKLFGRPLSDSHLQALTALFNWSLPEDLESGIEEVLVM